MAPRDLVMDLSMASQRAMMGLWRPAVLDTEHATSFASLTDRPSGFYSATIPYPDSDPDAVVAQAQQVQADTCRSHFVWAPASSPLSTTCWQDGLSAAYPLAVMSADPDHHSESRSGDVVHVTDHEGADLFRQIHLDQFGTAADPGREVEHFASDHVLLDPSVQALVILDDGHPAAAGYLHTTGGVSGIYWVATATAYRNRGHGGTITSALLDAAPIGSPVVLQATTLGRPVYLRHRFQDHGLVWCWAVKN